MFQKSIFSAPTVKWITHFQVPSVCVCHKHINFIAVYAPTEVDDEEESENFYETLQDQLARINKKKHVIVLGDFNARVGPLENSSRLHGHHNPDKRNVNGTRLVDFYNTNGLIITNTIFPHKRIHQWTYHPNQKKRTCP